MTEWIGLGTRYPSDNDIIAVKAQGDGEEYYGIGTYTARSGFDCIRYQKGIAVTVGWVESKEITHYKIVEEAQ